MVDHGVEARGSPAPVRDDPLNPPDWLVTPVWTALKALTAMAAPDPRSSPATAVQSAMTEWYSAVVSWDGPRPYRRSAQAT